MSVMCLAALSSIASAQGFDRNQRIPIFVVMPARGVNFATLGEQANAGVTIPFFQNHVTSPLDHHVYTFQIAGTDPTVNKVSTTIQYVPVALRVHFADGTVLDPSKPGCNDTVPVSTRFFTGPLFTNVPLTSNGINVGTTQIIDGFQRAEFWSLVHGSTYHLLLSQAHAPRLIDVNAPAGSVTSPGACSGKGHNLGQIPINGWDNIVVTQINKFAKTNQLPIIAAYNVVETAGGCCIIGYHNAYGRAGGTQTYATGAYTDAGIFGAPGIQDIHAWTHEIGEWANDPFINNATPAWGHVGQVSGCQNNFEVGDPLTGTAFTVVENGFTYHPQEMAFFDWFYRTLSKGTGAEFSFEGTFEASQAACH
jgi:hypothetical protein